MNDIYLCNYYLNDIEIDGTSFYKGELIIVQCLESFCEELHSENPDLIDKIVELNDICLCVYIQANNSFIAADKLYSILQKYEREHNIILIQ